MIRVLDTETTGLDPETDRVVEVAAVELLRRNQIDLLPRIGALRRSFVNPHRPIPPQASAVHHIIDADVVDAPDLEEALDLVLGPGWENSPDVFAAHNCRYDMKMLPPELHKKQWVDTYRCALHVWPDAPAYGNQVLRYWLGIDLPREGAHRALQDATVTTHILLRLLAERPVEELLRLSTKAVVLKTVLFGKHRGALWTDVPTHYLEWVLEEGFADEPDVRYTAKYELKRRKDLGPAITRHSAA